jgi:hypothetical protein
VDGTDDVALREVGSDDPVEIIPIPPYPGLLVGLENVGVLVPIDQEVLEEVGEWLRDGDCPVISVFENKPGLRVVLNMNEAVL